MTGRPCKWCKEVERHAPSCRVSKRLLTVATTGKDGRRSMKKLRTERFSGFSLPPDLARRVMDCSKATGVEPPSIVRMALHVYLTREGFN